MPPAPHLCVSQGELTITTDMEDLSTALFYDTVPDPWVARAYPSMMGLAAWYADLLLRIRVRPLSPGVPADPHPRGQQNMGYEGRACPRQRPRGPHRPGLCRSRAGRARPTPHRHPGCRRPHRREGTATRQPSPPEPTAPAAPMRGAASSTPPLGPHTSSNVKPLSRPSSSRPSCEREPRAPGSAETRFRQELEAWTTDFALPTTVWLAGFFNPQSFLTAIMQSMARKNEWPLDKMCLSVEVTKRNREDMTAPPREGSYVYGLFMEGNESAGRGSLQSQSCGAGGQRLAGRGRWRRQAQGARQLEAGRWWRPHDSERAQTASGDQTCRRGQPAWLCWARNGRRVLRSEHLFQSDEEQRPSKEGPGAGSPGQMDFWGCQRFHRSPSSAGPGQAAARRALAAPTSPS